MEPTVDTSSSSRKKPIIIGAIILIVLAIISVAVYLFLTGDRAPQITTDPNRVASLDFQFEEVTATRGENLTLDILLESDIAVTGADIILAYDPSALALTAMQPTIENFMGAPQEYEIVENIIDNDAGRAYYRIRARDTGEPPSVTRQGRGVIASLRLAVHPTFEGSKTPIIIFKDEEVRASTSWVAKANYNGSILDTAGSILINVQ